MLGVEPHDAEDVCGSVGTPARVANPWGVEEERDVPIVVCRDLKMTLPELWAARAAPQHRGH